MKKILLVDDEEIIVKSLKEGLKKYEKDLFETDIAFNAKDALKLIKKNTYHLVVSDIRLPDKSGVELFLELKKIQPACKFIAITAFSNPEVKEKVEELGALKYLEKPFDFKEFEELVLKAVEEESTPHSERIEDLIELTTLLQLINMEKKTLVLWVVLDGQKGYIAFENGEIIDAKFGNLRGVEAVNFLIMKNKGKLKIDRGKKARKRTINIPFMTLLLNAVKTKDDMERESKDYSNINSEAAENSIGKTIIEKVEEEFEKIANKFKEIDCLYIFDFNGELLAKKCFNGKDFDIKDNISTFSIKVESLFKQKVNININLLEVLCKNKILFFRWIQIKEEKFIFVIQLDAKVNYPMFKQSLTKFFDGLTHI